jgi:phenylalanyl-tRNA synthetase beta chain
MQISLQWLNELISVKSINLPYLIDKLTLGGFEVEKVIEREFLEQNIIILDISSTANRSDSLSIKGISKEIATLFNKPYKNSKYLVNNLNWEAKFQDLIINSKINEFCLSFLAITIENINNFESPNWLKYKLIQSGIEPFNTLLDFQNYILLENGYPIEVYDLNKIYKTLNTKSFKLNLTNSNKTDFFLASNNIIYKLNNEILTIKANNKTIGLAGFISHKNFCYDATTNSLLIEASNFNSTIIRQQSRVVGLRTDRSSRYEKAIKNVDLFPSVYKLLNLLKIKNPNLVCKIHTFLKIVEKDSNPILLNYKKINEILGPIKGSHKTQINYINSLLISKYLDRLQFNYEFNNIDLSWKVKIPSSRNQDIVREIDLIEEIGRLHGFNKFLTRLPILKEIGKEDNTYKIRKKLTAYLINNGFNELIHYSLKNDNSVFNENINLINPLLSEYSQLRTSLLPTLIRTIQQNIQQGNLYTDVFEYGHIFSKDKINTFKEQEYLSGIFGGTKTKFNWSEVPESISWFEGKGKMEQLFNQLKSLVYWKPYCGLMYKNILHPYRAAQINLNNELAIGVFGQIHPLLAKNLNISENLYLFEFNFDNIIAQFNINRLTNYKEYSLYPKILKDLSFFINYQTSFHEIKEILYLNGTKYLKAVILLDEYKGASIPENSISLCIQLIFQSNEKTLQNKDVEKIVETLKKNLIKNFNATIRI